MPTRNKIGWAAFNWIGLLTPGSTLRSFQNSVAVEWAKARYDGLSYQARLDKIFDSDLRDLSKLKVGYFHRKVLHLPRARLPNSEAELLKLCRQMIDRGENALYLQLMLESFPQGWTLLEHVAALWNLRKISVDLFEDIVQGFHGHAIVRFKSAPPEGLAAADFKGLLARHGLLWCAMDTQVAISGARVATTKPFGDFIDGSMKEPKGGTLVRLMRRGLVLAEAYLAKYRPLREPKTGEEKLKGREAKTVGHQSGKRLLARHARKWDCQESCA